MEARARTPATSPRRDRASRIVDERESCGAGEAGPSGAHGNPMMTPVPMTEAVVGRPVIQPLDLSEERLAQVIEQAKSNGNGAPPRRERASSDTFVEYVASSEVRALIKSMMMTISMISSIYCEGTHGYHRIYHVKYMILHSEKILDCVWVPAILVDTGWLSCRFNPQRITDDRRLCRCTSVHERTPLVVSDRHARISRPS